MMSSPRLLLLSSILLLSNQQPASGRPRLLQGRWDGVENLWLRSSAGEKVFRVLHSHSSEQEELLKRSEDPALSIDLTFHLLRNMIHMAQVENLRERAQRNRKVLDEVGRK